MKRILITGGHGFIGIPLALYLATANLYDVTTIDFKPAPEFAGSLWTSIAKNVNAYMKEMDDERLLKNLYDTTAYDVIIHLAAVPRRDISLAFPENILQNNINATIDVLGYCRKNPNTHLIYVSSEMHDAPNSPYACSKLAGEVLVETYRSSFGIKSSIVRLFTVFGDSETDYGDFPPSLIQAIKQIVEYNQPVSVKPEDYQMRDFVHVDDVVDGIAAIIGEIDNDTVRPFYELGSGSLTTSPVQVLSMFLGHEHFENVNIDHLVPRVASDSTQWPKYWYPKVPILEFVETWKASSAS